MLAFTVALVLLGIPAVATAAPVTPTPIPSASFDGAVRTVAQWGNVIYVGGDFGYAKVNGKYHQRRRLAAVDARDGSLLDWAPTADDSVTAMTVDASGVYIAGSFNYVNGSASDSLAKLDRTTGRLLPGFKHRIYGHPLAIAVAFGRVYLGGTLSSVDGQPRGRLAAFNSQTGALDTGWAPVASDVVLSILPAPDRLYLGGRFDTVNGIAGTQKVVALTPDAATVIPTFTSRLVALVHVIAVDQGILYVGIDGSGGHAAALDAATGDVKWTITTDGDVQAVALLGGTVYVGGHFDHVCKTQNVGDHGACLDGSESHVKLAAFDLNGQLLDWHADADGIVGIRSLLSDPVNGKLIAGGEFNTVNGLPQPRFAIFTLPAQISSSATAQSEPPLTQRAHTRVARAWRMTA